MSLDTIAFPHLHITLTHVGRGIHIGSFEIAFYGIAVAIAMVAGIYLAMWIAGKTGQDPDSYFSFSILAIILSVLGARAYYVIFSWDYYSTHPLEIINLRQGGLAIYGGVITGVICAVVYSVRHHITVRLFLDTAIPALTLGQAIGRWGNFFNREAFGGYTDGLLAMALPQEAVRADEITQEMLSHTVTMDGITFIQVHPTFLYESMWNLMLVAVMLIVTLKHKKHFDGQIFLIYMIGYGIGRFWIEGLRTDQLLLFGTGIPVSRLLSALMALSGAAAFVIMYLRSRKNQS